MRQSLSSTFTDEDLAFCQIDGKPLLRASITHTWTKLARRAGLKGVGLHYTRYTHASIMPKQGI